MLGKKRNQLTVSICASGAGGLGHAREEAVPVDGVHVLNDSWESRALRPARDEAVAFDGIHVLDGSLKIRTLQKAREEAVPCDGHHVIDGSLVELGRLVRKRYHSMTSMC